jgi:hypothetical protein
MLHYGEHQDDNKPLKNMDKQLKDMDGDYHVMLLERIESKKQLKAKFQDIERKIQANRDFTKAETKRVNDTLKAFRSKFEFRLRTLRELFEGKINAMRKFNREQFEFSDNRLNTLEENIEKEVQDRIEETDEIMNDTQTTLTSK